MKKQVFIFLFLATLISSCIQDDIIFDTVAETLRISNPIDTLGLGDTFQLETRFTNNIGEVAEANIQWSSSAPDIINVDNTGLLSGLSQGNAEIFAEVTLPDNRFVADTLPILVADQTTTVEVLNRSGAIKTTTFYTLEGDFEITQVGDDLNIEFASNYEASRSLPGLYVYLTNNPNTVNGALEIGRVEVFQGVHSYLVEDVDIKEYDYLFYFCKPFRVKVGDGLIQDN